MYPKDITFMGWRLADGESRLNVTRRPPDVKESATVISYEDWAQKEKAFEIKCLDSGEEQWSFGHM